MTKEPKKDANASMDVINTIVKDHFLACACDLFGVISHDEQLGVPPGTEKAPNTEKLAFINNQLVNKQRYSFRHKPRKLFASARSSASGLIVLTEDPGVP